MGSKKRIALLVAITVVALLIFLPLTNMAKKAYAVQGSTIGGIEVGSLSEEEIRVALSTAIEAWQGNAPQIEGGGASLTIDLESIGFDVETTIANYNALIDKEWYAFWESKNPVHIPIEVTGAENLKMGIENIGTWNVEETYELALQQIMHLKSEPIEAVVIDTSVLETERLTFIIQDIPTEAKAVYDLARHLDGTVIGAGERFSLLDTLGTVADNSNAEGLSFVASLLYRNALYTNTVITERHAQTQIPSYLEPGLEAYVNSATNKDLSFTNNAETPIKLKLSVKDQQLKVEFYSIAKKHDVSVHLTQSNEVNPRTIVRYSDNLSVGASRLLQEGEKGARVTVFRIVDGFEEQISRDYYPPTNRVIVKSSRVPITPSSGTGNTGGNANTTTTPDADDTLDLDNNGLPDINQGKGHEPKVDDDGNVVLPDGQTTDKAGNVISSGGNAS